MSNDLGGIPGSRERNPQAVSALTGFDPGRTRCHYCGQFLNPLDGSRFHFIPLNEFGPEEAWWECHPTCGGSKQ